MCAFLKFDNKYRKSCNFHSERDHNLLIYFAMDLSKNDKCSLSEFFPASFPYISSI